MDGVLDNSCGIVDDMVVGVIPLPMHLIFLHDEYALQIKYSSGISSI
jgi:hypothetical protein